MDPPVKKAKYCNKPKNFFKSHKKEFLGVGQRGFLATCNFREKECVRECYNLLNEYADELYGSQKKQQLTDDENIKDAASTDDSSDKQRDIADDLQKEIDSVSKVKGNSKDGPKHRFQVVDTGAINCVFIRTSLSDPVELGANLIENIASTRVKKSRVLLRLVPIEVVCKANVADIVKAAGPLFDKYFLKGECTFAVHYHKRYNNDVNRDELIHQLAELVQSINVKHRVDLKYAEKTVIVEIIKGLCCLSVVPNFYKYKKYNLEELCKPLTAETKKQTEELVILDTDAKKEKEIMP